MVWKKERYKNVENFVPTNCVVINSLIDIIYEKINTLYKDNYHTECIYIYEKELMRVLIVIWKI